VKETSQQRLGVGWRWWAIAIALLASGCGPSYYVASNGTRILDPIGGPHVKALESALVESAAQDIPCPRERVGVLTTDHGTYIVAGCGTMVSYWTDAGWDTVRFHLRARVPMGSTPAAAP
jgi:hypothetical protein